MIGCPRAFAGAHLWHKRVFVSVRALAVAGTRGKAATDLLNQVLVASAELTTGHHKFAYFRHVRVTVG